MKFIEFEETNDNEGETWRFWLQLEGNEEVIKILKDLIKKEEYEEWEDGYFLNDKVLDEKDVDVLVDNSDGGYMSFENKVIGKMKIPKNFEVDDLYKGGIIKLFN